MIFARVSTKSALGAVVTRVPAVTDLDADPCEVIKTGDWVRIDADQGVVEVSPVPPPVSGGPRPRRERS